MSDTKKPCRNCGTTRRHSDRYGCCGGCGRAFIGLAAFDAHFVGTGEDRGCATDPGGLRTRSDRPILESVEVEGGHAWRMWASAQERLDWAERWAD